MPSGSVSRMHCVAIIWELIEFKYIDIADILITVCSYHSGKKNKNKYSLINI